MKMRIYLELLFVFMLQNSRNIVTADDGKKHCPSEVKSSYHFVGTHRNTCYMFVNDEKFWDEARSYCWKMGGEMLFVEDKETMEYIKSVLNSRELNWSRKGVWVGASDLRDKGWEWTTGKKLSYTYWAEGEPSKTFGFLSFENCACMRRSDNWRWHDYHCHMIGYEYNFICQFPMVSSETYTGSHINGGAPLQIERDDRMVVIVLIVSGAALLIIIIAVVCFLYKKQQHQKREHQKRTQRYAARFQNTGYATIMQDFPPDQSHDASLSHDSGSYIESQSAARPVSNIYLDPVEVNRIYDEVNKDINITGAQNFSTPVNRAEGDMHETRRLVYTGGASSAGNLAAVGVASTPSEASGATSGYFSRRNGAENEYIEMSGGNSLASLTGLSSGSQSIGASVDNLKNCKGGATGSVHDVASTNMYVTPVFMEDKLNNADINGKLKGTTEIHIYSNRLDEIENNSLNSLNGVRPLPPLPKKDNSIPTKNEA